MAGKLFIPRRTHSIGIADPQALGRLIAGTDFWRDAMDEGWRLRCLR